MSPQLWVSTVVDPDNSRLGDEWSPPGNSTRRETTPFCVAGRALATRISPAGVWLA